MFKGSNRTAPNIFIKNCYPFSVHRKDKIWNLSLQWAPLVIIFHWHVMLSSPWILIFMFLMPVIQCSFWRLCKFRIWCNMQNSWQGWLLCGSWLWHLSCSFTFTNEAICKNKQNSVSGLPIEILCADIKSVCSFWIESYMKYAPRAHYQ